MSTSISATPSGTSIRTFRHDTHSTGLDRIGDKARAVRLRTRHRGEQKARLDRAAVRRQPRDVVRGEARVNTYAIRENFRKLHQATPNPSVVGACLARHFGGSEDLPIGGWQVKTGLQT